MAPRWTAVKFWIHYTVDGLMNGHDPAVVRFEDFYDDPVGVSLNLGALWGINARSDLEPIVKDAVEIGLRHHDDSLGSTGPTMDRAMELYEMMLTEAAAIDEWCEAERSAWQPIPSTPLASRLPSR